LSGKVQSEPNRYSRQWFQLFQEPIPDTRTAQETGFICDCLPLPDFRRIADVCCGPGRHAHALAQLGYAVTGIERDSVAIAKARSLGGAASYVEADIRTYRPPRSAFDAVIIMSQSFGYFDAQTNREIVRRLAKGLRNGGRIILDLWNSEFFAAHQGERELQSSAGVVRETKRVEKGRLLVRLDYPDGNHDDSDWELFAPIQMDTLAHTSGMALITVCTDFNAAVAPSPTKPRIQFVLERRA
jgi:SAM-dependent methyltransferase